jgi:hypothetical protein
MLVGFSLLVTKMIDNRFYELLAHLWRGGKYAYYWTPDDGSGAKYTYWLTATGDIDLPKMFADKDTYFSVNPSIIRRSEYERAHNTDIVAVNIFYCEFDCPTPEAKEAAAKKIQAWKIKPACVIDSGGGYHVYILLRAPLTDIARAGDLQWAFAQWAGGDTSVNDLARVLRVPGTTNYKAKYAPNFPLVAIVEWDMSRQYELADLEPILQPYIDARNAKAHTSTPAAATVSLSDSELLDVLFRSKNGDLYQRLWNGDDLGDHSIADQKLANGLAWVTGRDMAAMDRLFRQSGLMRDKWNRQAYRESTLQNAADSAQTVYTPGAPVDQDALNAANAAVGMNGASNGSSGGSQPQQAAQTAGSYKPPSNPATADYIAALAHLGYHFRLNELDDHIEVNGRRLDDVKISEIKNRMRDLGFKRSQIIDMADAYMEEAGRNRYHPIRQYLQSLQWNGDDHIRLLARHFEDKHPLITYDDGSTETVMYVWLKRWLIAAAAKAFQRSEVSAQNAVLVLEGGQNLGKSTFARWLCSGMPRYFIEKSIEPDSKEDERRLASKWIWEIGELGATTRKADREALKSFLTRVEVTFRNAYAKEDSEKLALASFIGTVNNEGGFLQDSTGNRRFMIVGLDKIQHSYIQDMDIDQVWAQAYHLYATGESWRLLPEETLERDKLNGDYKVEDPYEGWILRYCEIDPVRGDAQTAGWFVPSQELVSLLKTQGVTDSTTAISRGLPATMKGLGIEKTRQYKRTGAWGYWGLKIRP